MLLNKIENKVITGHRLTTDDALSLFQNDDIFTIGRLANIVAGRKNGNKAYFIQNHHINPTNICINRCKFCAFSRSKGEKGAYELSIGEIIDKLKEGQESRVKSQELSKKQLKSKKKNFKLLTHNSKLLTLFSEVHIVGGLHPDWDFGFYLEMLRAIKTNFPTIHTKAFTAVEIDYFSNISGLPLTETLQELNNAGLDSMPGGGAEIFDTRVRNRICPEKISGRRWLQVMEAAHRVGISTNATMLYGHLESYKNRVEHMLKLRDLQDRTGGFQAFIPLAFHPLNTKLGVRSQGSEVSKRNKTNPQSLTPNPCLYTSGIDDLKTIAISRLFLDNFQHIKAYWIMLGEKIAQLALMFGADDLDGTIIEEKITHSAGALSGSALTRAQLINLIEKTGKIPVERDSFYNRVKR